MAGYVVDVGIDAGVTAAVAMTAGAPTTVGLPVVIVVIVG